jgi:pyrimidine operon attenuation protein/uracil phosphoribosyltransferase
MSREVVLMSEADMSRTVDRLAYEILERDCAQGVPALVGIQRRGVELAQRIRTVLADKLENMPEFGKLDINLYRDDWTTSDGIPHISSTEIDFDVNGRNIILVDDVLYTGRTIRSALEAILDFGRPNSVKLLVLVDRGHRELPIHADYVGKTVRSARNEHVDVFLKERDGEDRVVLREE